MTDPPYGVTRRGSRGALGSPEAIVGQPLALEDITGLPRTVLDSPLLLVRLRMEYYTEHDMFATRIWRLNP